MAFTQAARRTPAEDALIAKAERSASGADVPRRDALARLRAEGLPDRRVEAWHYTDFRALLGRLDASTPTEVVDEPSYLVPLLPHSVVVESGVERASNDQAPGLTVEDRVGAPDWTLPLNHLDRDFDTIRLLNAALGAAGVRVAVSDGIDLKAPIELRAQPLSTGGQSFAFCEVGAGSRATVVERVSPDGHASLSTSVNELVVGDGADVLWIIDQAKGAGEAHLGQLSVVLGSNSLLRMFVLNAGGALVRQEIHCVTKGEGAAIRIRGVNFLEAGQHIDVTTTLNHVVPNTTSTEIFRNVVFGGRGVFQGMIRVAKGAQKTDARLACNSLLLSDEGDFSAKPELEIFADDVQCGHGATAGEIDANHLFYLMSRGIPETEARALLVKAFVAEVLADMEDEAAESAMDARVDAWLAAER